MGLKCAPDIAQEAMEQIFSNLQEDTEIYIDDIGVFFSNMGSPHPSIGQSLPETERKWFHS